MVKLSQVKVSNPTTVAQSLSDISLIKGMIAMMGLLSVMIERR